MPKISDLGFEIITEHASSYTRETTQAGVIVFLYNKDTDVRIELSGDSLGIFGYRTHGPCLGTSGVTRTDNEGEQFVEAVRLINIALLRLLETPKFSDAYFFLKEYRTDKPLLKNSISRVLEILNINDFYRKREKAKGDHYSDANKNAIRTT